MPTSSFQPIRLLDLDCSYKFTYLMANNADPDQLSSSEANWSGSTLFAKKGQVMVSKRRVKLCTSNNYPQNFLCRNKKNINNCLVVKVSYLKLRYCRMYQQGMPWWDCVDAQDDCNLHTAHMLEDTTSLNIIYGSKLKDITGTRHAYKMTRNYMFTKTLIIYSHTCQLATSLRWCVLSRKSL